jgi:anhydro-N-acetylmuramic acid kinase
MSGTSMDGVDSALLRTDGRGHIEPGASITIPYDEALRAELRACLGQVSAAPELVARLTDVHADAVRTLMDRLGLQPAEIDVIGFHGHTILHAPWRHVTIQIGDGDRLARLLGIDVVDQFRLRDVTEGGQGAPLVPLFHAALAGNMPHPVAVVNIGGVGNVSWIGAAFDATSGAPEGSQILAFDTGPGNGMIDDWVRARTGHPWDEGGKLALQGQTDAAALDALLSVPFFDKKPPKSLDRTAFDPSPVAALSTEDGAATLTAFTAASLARAAEHFPAPAKRWVICGGGRMNRAIMAELGARLSAPVVAAEAVGWDGDAMEAHAFAWMAVRALDRLPFTLPSTTGVSRPVSGGAIHLAPLR